jgi:hypothetical protein
VYVDAFNLYYGARTLCGRGTPGWRWLDIRTLVGDLVAAQVGWAGSAVTRVVYCTARIDAVINPSGHADQDVYLKALLASGSVDYIEYGHYVSRVKQAVLATSDPRTKRPVIVRPSGRSSSRTPTESQSTAASSSSPTCTRKRRAAT